MKLRQARNELDALRLTLDTMRNAADVGLYRRAWQEFVDRLEKVWSKLKLEVGDCRIVSICQQINRAASLRKTDALLQYLGQARHADQHTLQVATMYGLGISITLPPGTDLAIDFAKGTASAKGGDVKLEIGKPQYRLLPIKNRGVTFHPPSIHLGQVLLGEDPIQVAELGFAFYEDLVRSLEVSLEASG
ncbi:MAG: hypothetical protein LAP85_27275 [Acidobacteriia bacterium]|nr:hypothetical protein [Terriglobia bacterium]